MNSIVGAGVAHRHRDAVQSAHGVVAERTVAAQGARVVAIVGDELDDRGPTGSATRIDSSPKRGGCVGHREVARAQPRPPGVERARGNGERRHGDLSGALDARRDAAALVRKRRPDRARRTALVAVVEVIDAVIVEVHGLLHEPKPERVEAEIEIGLRVVDGGGDVVQPENWKVHLDPRGGIRAGFDSRATDRRH